MPGIYEGLKAGGLLFEESPVVVVGWIGRASVAYVTRLVADVMGRNLKVHFISFHLIPIKTNVYS